MVHIIIAWLLVSATLAVGPVVVVNRPVVCSMYPTSLESVVAMNYNLNRRALSQYLTNRFNGTVTAETHTITNCAFKSSSELVRIIDTIIQTWHCNVVISFSNAITDSIVNFSRVIPPAYPNVRFIDMNAAVALAPYLAPAAFAQLPLNYRGFLPSPVAAWFAAGAAAAVQCQVCTVFLTSMPSRTFIANAFIRGMRWAVANQLASRACPVHHLYTGSLEDPVTESFMTQFFLSARGCDIYTSYSNTQTVPSVIRAINADLPAHGQLRDPLLLSIGSIVDGTSVWGDSVLVSVLVGFEEALNTVCEDVVTNRTFRGVFEQGANGSQLSSFSPRAQRTVVSAATAAYAFPSKLCNGMRNQTGGIVFPNCTSEAAFIGAFGTTLDSDFLHYPRFTQPTRCPQGTQPTYRVSDLQLICSSCNSTATSAGGGSTCQRCPNGFVADANRSACLRVSLPLASTLSSPAIGGTVVAIVIGVLLCAVGVARWWWVRRGGRGQWQRRLVTNVPPPIGPVVGLVLVAVDNGRSAEGWRQHTEFAAGVFEAIEDAVITTSASMQGYLAYSCADVHLVATATEERAFLLADAIVRGYRSHEHGCVRHVNLRCVVSCGAVSGVVTATSTMPRRIRVQLVDTPMPPSPNMLQEEVFRAAAGGDAPRAEFIGGPVDEMKRVMSGWRSVPQRSVGICPSALRASDAAARRPSTRMTPATPPSTSSDEPPLRTTLRAAIERLVQSSPSRDVVEVQLAASWDQPLLSLTASRPSLLLLRDDCFEGVGGLQQDFEPLSSTLANRSPSTASLSMSLTLFDDFTMRRFGSLGKHDVASLLGVSSSLLRHTLQLLPRDQRRKLYVEATQKLHISVSSLSPQASASTSSKPKREVMVSEKLLLESVTLELLATMDEHELLNWMHVTAAVHCGYHAKDLASAQQPNALSF